MMNKQEESSRREDGGEGGVMVERRQGAGEGDDVVKKREDGGERGDMVERRQASGRGDRVVDRPERRTRESRDGVTGRMGSGNGREMVGEWGEMQEGVREEEGKGEEERGERSDREIKHQLSSPDKESNHGHRPKK